MQRRKHCASNVHTICMERSAGETRHHSKDTRQTTRRPVTCPLTSPASLVCFEEAGARRNFMHECIKYAWKGLQQRPDTIRRIHAGVEVALLLGPGQSGAASRLHVRACTRTYARTCTGTVQYGLRTGRSGPVSCTATCEMWFRRGEPVLQDDL